MLSSQFRYLWVDALCIVQEPPGQDEHQVLAMDAIYHFSQLTIVAASGGMPTLDFLASEPIGAHRRFRIGHLSLRSTESGVNPILASPFPGLVGAIVGGPCKNSCFHKDVFS